MPTKFQLIGDGHNDQIRKFLVEFFGEVVFIYTITLQGLSNSGVLGAAFANGFVIGLLIMATGHISGAHFNPAVTFATLLTGKIALLQAFLYVIAQLSGSVFGALLARVSIPGDYYINSTILNAGMTVPPKIFQDSVTGEFVSVDTAQGIIVEAILTYILISTIFCTAIDTDSNILAPLAIGLSVFVGVLAGGNVTGASMNPARSFGPAMVGSIFGAEEPWRMHYIYWIGPLFGAVITVLFYKIFHANDERRWLK